MMNKSVFCRFVDNEEELKKMRKMINFIVWFDKCPVYTHNGYVPKAIL